MHPDQLSITSDTVTGLVAGQFPAWRDLPVTPVASEGTVNALFRIGPRLVARFPLQPDDPERIRLWLEREMRAAGELASRTRFPVPEPMALGEPGLGYPLPWSVQTWLPGTTATEDDPGQSKDFARDLAEFIAEIRAIPTLGRPFAGSGRGGDLRSHDEWINVCFARSEGLLDVPRLRRAWDVLRALPRESADVMNHGDLTPGNVLVARGRLAGVLDTGGLGPADPALDLVAAWHLLEAGPRQVLREELGCGDLEWERGKAWAFEQAIGAVWYYADSNPAMARMGERTLARIMTTPLA